MKRAIALALVACLLATAADARRRHHRHHRSLLRTAIIVYVLAEDDCPYRYQGRALTAVERQGQRLACIYN